MLPSFGKSNTCAKLRLARPQLAPLFVLIPILYVPLELCLYFCPFSIQILSLPYVPFLLHPSSNPNLHHPNKSDPSLLASYPQSFAWIDWLHGQQTNDWLRKLPTSYQHSWNCSVHNKRNLVPIAHYDSSRHLLPYNGHDPRQLEV